MLMHGAIGTMHKTSSEMIKVGVSFDPRLIVMGTSSQREHVVRPNAAAGGVDIFVHTWNPEGGTFIDRSYGANLRASMHEPVNRSLPKPNSQALSIGRAAQLMRAHERSRGVPYTMAFVMRIDLVVGAPVDLRRFRPSFVYFASHCCKNPIVTPQEKAAERRQCGATSSNEPDGGKPTLRPSLVLGHCKVSDRWSMGKLPGRSAETDMGFFLLDWWFAAPPEVAAGWINIHTRWPEYLAQMRRLRLGGIGTSFSHYVWPVHIHVIANLSARVRFADLQVELGRNSLTALAHGQPLRDCPYISVGKQAVGSQQALLDKPLLEEAFTRVEGHEERLYLGVFTQKIAPMSRMCPYLQLDSQLLRNEPIVCCGGRCGKQRCDASTNATLFNTTLQLLWKAARGSRMVNDPGHGCSQQDHAQAQTPSVAEADRAVRASGWPGARHMPSAVRTRLATLSNRDANAMITEAGRQGKYITVRPIGSWSTSSIPLYHSDLLGAATLALGLPCAASRIFFSPSGDEVVGDDADVIREGDTLAVSCGDAWHSSSIATPST